jgi:hypothetical protein
MIGEIGGLGCSGGACEEPDYNGTDNGIYWDENAGFTSFTVPGAAATGAYGLNNQGLAVGAYFTGLTAPSGSEGFIVAPSTANPAERSTIRAKWLTQCHGRSMMLEKL